MLQQEALRSEFLALQFEVVGLNIRSDFWFGSEGNCNNFLGNIMQYIMYLQCFLAAW